MQMPKLDFKVTFDASQTKEIEKAIDRLQASVFKERKRAANAAAEPIRARAQVLAPDSRSTQTAGGKSNGPTRVKWSKKYRDNPQWTNIQVKDWVRKKSLSGNVRDVTFVGMQWPKGNKANFNYTSDEKGREEVFWGRRSGKTWKPVFNFLKRSLDEKQSEFAEIFAQVMKEAVRSA
jgi:hypothetical protein